MIDLNVLNEIGYDDDLWGRLVGRTKETLAELGLDYDALLEFCRGDAPHVLSLFSDESVVGSFVAIEGRMLTALVSASVHRGIVIGAVAARSVAA